jgi:secondary thiamine-phosphate synthase enzyme
MISTIKIETDKHQGLYDITGEVESALNDSGIDSGVVTIFARGATAAIMIQENWDDSVQNDVINLLNQLIPAGVWEHDRQDNNGDSHLKAGIIGPSENIPVDGGKLMLSTWQNIFFCEFDGPRIEREICIQIIESK